MKPFTIYVDVKNNYASRKYLKYLSFIPHKIGMILEWIEEAGIEVPNVNYKVKYTPDKEGSLLYQDGKIYSESCLDPEYPDYNIWAICMGPRNVYDPVKVKREIIWRASK